MTCMSMYKTTKIVPVKVVRLIDFSFSLPWSQVFTVDRTYACSLVVKW